MINSKKLKKTTFAVQFTCLNSSYLQVQIKEYNHKTYKSFIQVEIEMLNEVEKVVGVVNKTFAGLMNK